VKVNIRQAKTHLSRLLQRVAAGEEVAIARVGVPVAKLIAASSQTKSRPTGMDKDKIWIAEDFDASDPAFEALFYDAPLTTAPTRTRRKKRRRTT
jgi:prevent-host-death family protein